MESTIRAIKQPFLLDSSVTLALHPQFRRLTVCFVRFGTFLKYHSSTTLGFTTPLAHSVSNPRAVTALNTLNEMVNVSNNDL